MGKIHDETRLVPTHPSNRNVLDQCLLWGWTIRVSTGDWVELQHPDRADKVRVRAASSHAGNGRDTLAQLYKITCRGDATQFWTRVEPYHARPGKPRREGMTDEQMEAYAAQQRARHETPLDRLDRAAGLRVVPDPPEDGGRADNEPPASMPEPRGKDETGNRYRVRPQERTIESQILETLERAGLRTLTLDVLKALLPELERGQLSNGMSRLCERGFVEHAPPRGNYRYTPPPKIAEPASLAAARPAEPPAPGTPNPAPAPATSAHDDTVDALLDLMFPDGVKTRHLGALEEWRRRTLELLREIHGD